jgi:flagellar capping protein FliD
MRNFIELIQDYKIDFESMKNKTDNFIKKYNHVMANMIRKHSEEVNELKFKIALLEKENEKLVSQNKGLRNLSDRIEKFNMKV